VQVIAFLAGTGLACLVLGVSLGTVSAFIPPSAGVWVEGETSIVLFGLGLLLSYNPHILRHHEHDHSPADHDHDPDDPGLGCCATSAPESLKEGLSEKLKRLSRNRKSLPLALFPIGFVNMIIPCPTAAVMYGYAF
jgi:nickel/cobalt exporter